jgi:phosphoglycolate phosphatase
LHDDAIETLDHFKREGFRQMILSAMHKEFLLRLVRNHSIEHYFSEISGIDDHYAEGKIEIGKKLLNGINGNTSQVIMVGDTIHDHEVAAALGIDVILVANGHQSEERLKSAGCPVVDRLEHLKEIL